MIKKAKNDEISTMRGGCHKNAAESGNFFVTKTVCGFAAEFSALFPFFRKITGK